MSDEPDVEQLRQDVDRIKEAMGLAERYEGLTEQWLLFGFLVAIAAGISQYVMLEDLPGYWHGIAWLGIMFGGGFLGVWWLSRGEPGSFRARDDHPGIWFIYAVSYLAVFPLQLIIGEYVGQLDDQGETLLVLSLILVLIGLAYLLVGNAMRAYRIRDRDRYAFYAGGLLMMGLGTAIPYVDFLQTWAYATMGGLYLVYAVVTYLVLTRT